MKLILENGKTFNVNSYTNEKNVVGEIIYNSDFVSYEEIITSPIYKDKIVLLTYPLIGNSGLIDEDKESKNIQIKALITSTITKNPSNFRYNDSLKDALNEENILGVKDCDTRYLLREIINNKINKCAIVSDDYDTNLALNEINNYKVSNDIYKKITEKKIKYFKTKNPLYNILILDFGVDKSLINYLNNIGINVILAPYNLDIEEIKRLHVDGIILSNGPEYLDLIDINIKDLVKLAPTYGIGLGASLLAREYNYEIKELEIKHFNSNNAVKNLITNKIDFYKQNHSLTIKNSNVDVTHINLVDNSVEGFKVESDKVLATFFNPNLNLENVSFEIDKFLSFIKEVK